MLPHAQNQSPLGNLLVRTDANIAIGTGHVMRCLALAQAWQDLGGCAVFAMAEATAAVEARLRSEGMEVVTLRGTAGTPQDSNETAQLAASNGADWVVVDGYQFGAEYQLALKSAGHKVLFVDDNGHAERYSADLVLNQNACASEDYYRNRNSGTELLLGLQYGMLRREFRNWRNRQRDIPKTASKILVTSGGSDAANLTPRVIDALDLIGLAGLEATIVAGGSNPHIRELETAVGKAKLHLRLLQNVTSMAELMADAHVAISAAGTTVLELAFMGVPTILVTVADHQRSNAEACEKLEIAQNLGDLSHVTPARLATALSELISDPEHRSTMTSRARLSVDGLGAERVAARLAAGNRKGRNG
jgi:UDP-2,4-diacetamido-2,4,6-trideoxy-beta-L-altropyranose hydrolase